MCTVPFIHCFISPLNRSSSSLHSCDRLLVVPVCSISTFRTHLGAVIGTTHSDGSKMFVRFVCLPFLGASIVCPFHRQLIFDSQTLQQNKKKNPAYPALVRNVFHCRTAGEENVYFCCKQTAQNDDDDSMSGVT